MQSCAILHWGAKIAWPALNANPGSGAVRNDVWKAHGRPKAIPVQIEAGSELKMPKPEGGITRCRKDQLVVPGQVHPIDRPSVAN